MRLHSAVLCDSYEAIPGAGYNFSGVTPTLTFTGIWHGQPGASPPPLPVRKRLVLLLLDGEVGPHNLLISVLHSGNPTPVLDRPIPFSWPADVRSWPIDIELEMRLPGGGLYDFHILIDGEPSG